MPGRGNGGRGNGAQGDGRGRDATTGERGDERGDWPGRPASSPGHLKKAAGAQLARDFAPGRRGRGEGTDQEGGETLA